MPDVDALVGTARELSLLCGSNEHVHFLLAQNFSSLKNIEELLRNNLDFTIAAQIDRSWIQEILDEFRGEMYLPKYIYILDDDECTYAASASHSLVIDGGDRTYRVFIF
jgi:hypothetical protein